MTTPQNLESEWLPWNDDCSHPNWMYKERYEKARKCVLAHDLLVELCEEMTDIMPIDSDTRKYFKIKLEALK